MRSTPFAVDRRFRALQFVSSSLISLGHGGNDAQKTMGIITVLLFSQGVLQGDFHVPFWVVLSCQAAMALGTLCGGWRIVRTMGSRITHLKPMQGFCAETGGALALFGATWLGMPVSTTHTITGSIVGVGAARRISAVRWGVARGIVVAWGSRCRPQERWEPCATGPRPLCGTAIDCTVDDCSRIASGNSPRRQSVAQGTRLDGHKNSYRKLRSYFIRSRLATPTAAIMSTSAAART